MTKSLVLTEKPSVARDIAKVLGANRNGGGFIEGGNYVITWALGHLVTLADPEEYSDSYKTWSLETLPMLPEKMRLVVMKETSHQYRAVQTQLHRSDIRDVIIATDSGREGELVARWILMKAGNKKPIKRLWISSYTAKSVKDGFNALRPGAEYDNLYKSAQARAEADWLVGLNVTRALTCKFGAQLSGGRVQTPTLALIVRREEEIRAFKPKDYYTVKAKFEGFEATRIDAQRQTRIFSKSEADDVLEKAKGKSASVAELKKQYKQKAPPAAYDLTELQRDANKKYAYSAKETLQYMQSLYEYHKVLTYPRTDSRYITEDVAATIPVRLKAVSLGPYKEAAGGLLRGTVSARYIVNSAKVTDHHAIIPTEERPDLSAMSPQERNIYDLAVRRFLAVLSAPFEYEETSVVIKLGGQTFTAKGKTVKNAGWKSVYGTLSDLDEEEDSGGILPPLKQGDKLAVKTLLIETGKTKPPARYTEAALLSAMENPYLENKALRESLQNTSGLGTPATRAEIIEKLFSSFYIERNGKELYPTSKGTQLISLVPADLKSAELTAKWETELSKISRGQASFETFIKDMRKYAAELTALVKASTHEYRHDNLTREKCPECGKNLLSVKGKKGQMLVCSDRECGYRKSLTVQTNARCPNCHKKLELRGEGEGRIFACVCGHREKLSDFEKRRTTAGANKNDVKRYLQNQDTAPANSGLKDALSKWLENNSD